MRKKIKIIGQDGEKIYSLGKIVINNKGEIIIAHEIPLEKTADFHTTRHADGNLFWTSRTKEFHFLQPLRQGKRIEEFEGIEYLDSKTLDKNSLVELQFVKNYDTIFNVDLTKFTGELISITIALATEEHLNELEQKQESFKERQTFVFRDNNPNLVITAYGGFENKEGI